MFGKSKRFLDDINSKLWLIIVIYIVMLAAWIVGYTLGGHRYYAEPVPGLFPDLFKVIGGNLVFFGIFGLVTLIPTFTRPSDEPIDRRLSFLITSKHVSPMALSFIRQEIVRLCGYIEASSVELIMREYDPETMAIKLEYRARALARNTFESENYVDDNFVIVVHPDQVKKDGLYGEITLAEFGYGNDVEEIIKTPLRLTNEDKFRTRTIMKIAKGSVTTYRLHNWIWFKSSEPYYMHAARYTESLTLSINNATDRLIRISNEAGAGEEISLNPNEVKELFQGPALPGTMNVFQVIEVGEPAPVAQASQAA